MIVRRTSNKPRRSGIVLLVVMSLLALFAALGLTFVFYADSESASSAMYKQSDTASKADVDPELLLAFFLNQLANGPGDAWGLNGNLPTSPNATSSAMRGLEMSRNLYGYNVTAVNPSTYPYTGVGRMGTGSVTPAPGWPALNFKDLNMTYCPADYFILDPEHSAPRPNPNVPLATPYVGWNVPYSYADPNSPFLGTMNASGEILSPSWWRFWDQFGYSNGNMANAWVSNPMDPNNPNWSAVSPWLKYLTPRPHPSIHPFFPKPQDGGGDVKNVEFGPGMVNPFSLLQYGPGPNSFSAIPAVLNPVKTYFANDSPWMDLGYPILTSPDGRKYKPVFASFITDNDSKVNPSIHGNILGTNHVNASAVGLGPWEVNPAMVLTGGDYANIFTGNGTLAGRYGLGAAGVPGFAGASTAALISSLANLNQMGLDLNGTQEIGAGPTYPLSTKYWYPGENGNANGAYFGYLNFGTKSNSTYGISAGNPLSTSLNALSATELAGHPSIFNIFNPSYGGKGPNFAFPASDIEALVRYMGTNSPALSSTMFRLAPASLGDPTGQTRQLLTSWSYDIGMPGVMPWLGTPGGNSYQFAAGAYPTGPLTAYSPQLGAGEFAPQGQSYNPALLRNLRSGAPAAVPPVRVPGKINLNRTLTPYPPVSTANGQIANLAQYQQAVADRQLLAQDIFNVLVLVTMGVPVNPATNTPNWIGAGFPAMATLSTSNQPLYNAVQWLAQLSANIVDFRDTDNYSTPFNWNPADTTVNGWVFGVEIPRLVVSEVYAEVANNLTDKFTATVPPKATLAYNLNTWVELANTFNSDPNIATNPNFDAYSRQRGAVRLQVGTTPIYQVVLVAPAQPALLTALPRSPVGAIAPPASAKVSTMNNFTNTNVSNPNLAGYNPNTDPQLVMPLAAGTYKGTDGGNLGFYVLGPTATTATAFPATAAGAGATAVKPTLTSASMAITGITGAVATNLLPTTIDCYLQRLACPDMPYQNTPTLPNYNPYITVDYLTGININNGLTHDSAGTAGWAVTKRYSMGRRQYFTAGPTQPVPAGPPATAPTAAALVQTLPYQVVPQQPNPAYTNQPQHTMFRLNAVDMAGANTPAAPAAATKNQTLTMPFNWLVHADRQVTSPVELLHVSGYPPYLLTQYFMGGTAPRPAYFGHMSMSAWFDTQARIFRAMEFFDAGIRAGATQLDTNGNPFVPDIYGRQLPMSGRVPGKINLNMYWDQQILKALCDPQALSMFTQADITNLHNALVKSRTPLGLPGPNDKPFYGMIGNSMNLGVGPSVDDTYFRGNPAGQASPIVQPSGSRLFSINPSVTGMINPATGAAANYAGTTSVPLTMQKGNNPSYSTAVTGGAPPFTKVELLNKIYNSVSSRSNVFSVWLTVGFFDVTDGPLSDPSLVNSATNPSGALTVSAIVKNPNGSYTITPTGNLLSGKILGVPWVIQPGCCVWVGNGGNAEPVIVQSTSATSFIVNFVNAHAPGETIAMKGVLGQEVGISEGRNTRHRMFAVVDRSALSIPSTLTPTNLAVVSNINGQNNLNSLPAGAVMGPAVLGGALPGILPNALAGSAYSQSFTLVIPLGGKVVLSADFGAQGTAGLAIKTISGGAVGTVSVKGTPNKNVTGNYAFQLQILDKLGNVTATLYYYVPVYITVPLQQPPGTPAPVVLGGQNLGNVASNGTPLTGVTSVSYPAQINPQVGPSAAVSNNWQIQPGMTLEIDPTVLPYGGNPGYAGNPEFFVLAPGPILINNLASVPSVNPAGNSITTILYKPHIIPPAPNALPGPLLVLPGQPGAVPFTIMGNPGPQLRFDHRMNTALVPHYSIIK